MPTKILSAIRCNELRRLGRQGPYIKIADFSNQESRDLKILRQAWQSYAANRCPCWRIPVGLPIWHRWERQTMGTIEAIFLFLRAFIIGHATVAIENLALRQQVAVFKHSGKRPQLRRRDRIFWVFLSRVWPNWNSAMAIVQPETVIAG